MPNRRVFSRFLSLFATFDPPIYMSQNKRPKMDLDPASSSPSVIPQEMASTSMEVGGEGDIVQETAGRGSDENKKVLFDPATQDFREAVKWTGFVDKTLLIEELLLTSEPKCVIIVAPRLFGKSLNMDMVKRFFEIEPSRQNKISKPPQDLEELEKYKNYKAFKRYGQAPKCKILYKVELVKEYFGRHPVVHLDFSTVNTDSTQTLQDSFRTLVRKAYLEHDYLQCVEIFSNPISNQNANETCRNWCDDEKYLKKDAIHGLQTLIKYLHAYHKREVYFLVDEFDAPATKALLDGQSGGEVRKISSEVTHLLGSIVKGEINNEHLLGSLITGASYLASNIDICMDLNNITVYKGLLNDRFAPYYGLHDYELTPLLEYIFPNDKGLQDSIHSEVKDLYNGYFFKGKSVYCLWSVLHYINLRSTLKPSEIGKISFWGRSSIITKMSLLLKDPYLMEEMIKLMSGGHLDFSSSDNVNSGDLADFLHGKSYNRRTVHLFLMDQGYLSHIPDQENESANYYEYVYAKIPNLDVHFAYKEMFMEFCLSLGLKDSVMTRCGEIFKDLRKNCNEPEKCKELIRDLCEKLKELLSQFQGKEDTNESAIQAALYATMLKSGFTECNCKRSYRDADNFDIVDLYMLEGNFAIIFEIKFVTNGGETTKNFAHVALKEIIGDNTSTKVPYVYLLDKKKIEYSLLAGLCVDREYKLSMCCLLNDRNPVNCFYVPEN